MAQPAINFISSEDYLATERLALEKHEYYKGEVFAMSGASFEHNVIEDNIRGILYGHLKGRPCRSFGSNLRVHIPSNTLYTYPDVLIVCEEPEFLDGEFDTLLNPAVIIEILSPSTGNYDRGAKWDLYREIESLKEYILIDSTAMHIVQYVRNNDKTWILSENKKADAHFTIQAIGLALSLSEVYDGVSFS
ncbi:MAG: hypothetical protein JWP69_377 [Flaviaesturariibacter sp.]|nr:hypothetical protein [Flaviaesturariibacter sp.]